MKAKPTWATIVGFLGVVAGAVVVYVTTREAAIATLILGLAPLVLARPAPIVDADGNGVDDRLEGKS